LYGWEGDFGDSIRRGETIKHFFLVGGCNGAKPGRNYYSEFVDKSPEDTVIIVLACGKFRFFDRDLGPSRGFPD
jgi:hydroxylamine reductase